MNILVLLLNHPFPLPFPATAACKQSQWKSNDWA